MRRTELHLTYDNTDVSLAVAGDVMGFTFTDHAHGKADDFQVTLKDDRALWSGSWFPEKGATLKPSFFCRNWFKDGNNLSLQCGVFTIDDIEASGPPDQVVIKAVSSLVTTGMKGEKRTRWWENTDLEQVAKTLAKENNVNLFYSADEPILFDRVDQRQETDLGFLTRICDENGLKLKVADEKIVVFEASKFDAQTPSVTLVRGDALIKSHSFQASSHDIYRACTVKYWKPEAKEELSYTFTPPNPPSVGQVLMVNRRFESQAAAMDAARAELRAKNQAEIKGTMTLVGHPGVAAGLVASVQGFGIFSGTYFIEKADHAYVRGSGYTTSIQIRKTLEY